MKKLLLLLLVSLSFASVHAAEATTVEATPILYSDLPSLISAPLEDGLMCTMQYDPVCGVDNKTYSNACMAGKTSIAYQGECDSYIDPIAYEKLEYKTEILKRQLSKYSDAKLLSVLTSIDQRIAMVKLSKIVREMQVKRITLYTFVKNTIPMVLAERVLAPIHGKMHGIENISYTIDGVNITLKNGVSEASGASKTITKLFGESAVGDINADGKYDVVLLLTQETGGSGVFYYAAAAIMTENGYVATNAVFLGDRIAPQTTEIKDGQVIVNYSERKAGEAMTVSPSVGVSKYLKMVDGKLVEGKR